LRWKAPSGKGKQQKVKGKIERFVFCLLPFAFYSGGRHVNGDMGVRRFAVSIQARDCISGRFHVE
jgi:hypothetical protein